LLKVILNTKRIQSISLNTKRSQDPVLLRD
jgi:hypothetical protein